MTSAGSTTIAGLGPALSGACSLAALVIAKQDPKVLPSKRGKVTELQRSVAHMCF